MDWNLVFLIAAIVCFVFAALETVGGGQPGRFKVNILALGLLFLTLSFLPALA